MPDHIKTYIKAIERELKVGQATEHTHRHALKQLIESLLPKVTATNEPTRVQCGAPDFLVSKARGDLTIGYIETKDIGKSLDEAEKSGQLKRYRRSLENLILTDYLEFRWYVDGELRDKARLAGMVKPDKLARVREDEAQVLELLKNFLDHPPARVGTPQELAGRMARLTHMIRDIIIEAFETKQVSPLLAELRQAFARTLIPDLDTPAKTGEFADMYAQTIAYGLFAARCNHQDSRPFKRLGAAGEIPRTNPFLRRLFETITGTELDDEPYAGFVDDLVQLFGHADMEAVLEHFGQRSRNRDPVVHFYETFLAEYDPKLREKRGVYYTPEAIVSYIVHSVDHILKDRFDCPQGLADTSTLSYTSEDGTHHEAPKVLILDPACGTGTFLYTVVDLIRDQFMKRRDAGMWSGYVRKHLLPRLFGFELLMAPYAVAHFKLGMQLAGQDMIPLQRDTWRYDFASHERLGIYLTNTLEEAERVTQRDMYFLERTIAEEADSAAEIKRDLPIMVIMGNPPYSGHSANRSQYDQKVQKNEEYITGWTAGPNGNASPLKTTAKHEGFKRQPTFIGRLIKDYFVCNKEWLQERNPKWLQDDYVKFIRWAQWRIERTGAGVLGFITNHGYLDNPTFRGMRWQLMKAFSEIYILDLHGNAKKKEVSPDGSKDENVFDIQQGVSIGIFIKEPNKAGPAKVFHSEMYGVRKGKYLRLYERDLASTKWAKLNPRPPFYLFLPQDTRRFKEYERGWPVTEILPVNSVGLVTARDKLTIHMTPEEVWETVRDFSSLIEEKARKKYSLGKDVRDWKVHLAQADLQANGPVKEKIIPVLYRPFDTRYTYYTGQTRGFMCMPRPKVMRHMLAGNNLAIITSRLNKGETFQHAQVTKNIVEVICMSPKTSNNGFVFPLYLFPEPKKNSPEPKNKIPEAKPWPEGQDGRIPNLAPEFVRDVEKRLKLKFVSDGRGDLKKTFGPEDIFHYIYAILHSPAYRKRYAEFLKIDFPRVPLTSNRGLFRRLCGLGRELAALHLMEPDISTKLITSFPERGDNLVAKGHPKYLAPGEPEPGTGAPLKKGRVYINKNQYFDGVPLEVWEFHVGGYQVCEKWLKDRRGRNLGFDDLTHYQKVIVALKETRRLMADIDAAVPAWPVK